MVNWASIGYPCASVCSVNLLHLERRRAVASGLVFVDVKAGVLFQ